MLLRNKAAMALFVNKRQQILECPKRHGSRTAIRTDFALITDLFLL
jgi:hypothetical protein